MLPYLTIAFSEILEFHADTVYVVVLASPVIMIDETTLPKPSA
jgi:hypothetical protein